MTVKNEPSCALQGGSYTCPPRPGSHHWEQTPTRSFLEQAPLPGLFHSGKQVFTHMINASVQVLCQKMAFWLHFHLLFPPSSALPLFCLQAEAQGERL